MDVSPRKIGRKWLNEVRSGYRLYVRLGTDSYLDMSKYLEPVMVLHGMIGMMLEMMLKTTVIKGDVAMATLADVDLILNGYGVHYWSKRSPGHDC